MESTDWMRPNSSIDVGQLRDLVGRFLDPVLAQSIDARSGDGVHEAVHGHRLGNGDERDLGWVATGAGTPVRDRGADALGRPRDIDLTGHGYRPSGLSRSEPKAPVRSGANARKRA
jgi:hypothetical protein